MHRSSLNEISLRASVGAVLTRPEPDGLWRLRADLLESGVPIEAAVFGVVDRFHSFLDHLRTTSSSREYSNFASMLDIGAIAGVLAERVIEPCEAEDLAMRLFGALISEGLMAAATRQHVRAWENELAAEYRAAAWSLYADLWRWAERQKPELDPGERRRLLDHLVAPLLAEDVSGLAKAALAGRLFQILLVSRVADVLAATPRGGECDG